MASAERNERAAAKLKRLRRRIERWRWTRTSRGPMPAKLWVEATELGRELGAYRVAHDLGLGYESLRDRLGGHGGAEAQEGPAFVAIDPASLFATAPTVRSEVELSDASGVKVVIRLGAGEAVDVAALLAAFRAAAR